ncbi:hypothetical protein R6Z07M_018853 [Ovis aries]
MDSAVPAVQPRAQPPPPDVCPPLGSEEEYYDCPDYYYLRDFPACGAGRIKGRTRPAAPAAHPSHLSAGYPYPKDLI